MLGQLAALLLGLLAGAMLFIGVVLVPFWHALPPAELRGWFARHAGRTGALAPTTASCVSGRTYAVCCMN